MSAVVSAAATQGHLVAKADMVPAALEALAEIQTYARMSASEAEPSVRSSAVDRASASLEVLLLKAGALSLRARPAGLIYTDGCHGAKPLAICQELPIEESLPHLAALLQAPARQYILSHGTCAQALNFDQAVRVLTQANCLPISAGTVYPVLARVAKERPELVARLSPCVA